MAAFVPHVTIQISIDGKTVTVTDDSNYSSNTDGVTLNNVQSRTDVITDGKGNTIATIVFPAGQITQTFQITTDHVLIHSLDWVIANSSHKTATVKSLTENIYYNGLINYLQDGSDCGCNGNNVLCNDAAKAMLSISGAEFYYTYGMDSNAETLINASNSLINS